eukprot:5354710-Prymnesium_polylepis.1
MRSARSRLAAVNVDWNNGCDSAVVSASSRRSYMIFVSTRSDPCRSWRLRVNGLETAERAKQTRKQLAVRRFRPAAVLQDRRATSCLLLVGLQIGAPNEASRAAAQRR